MIEHRVALLHPGLFERIAYYGMAPVLGSDLGRFRRIDERDSPHGGPDGRT